MVSVSPYRQFFEAHRSSFPEAGYSEKESTALAQGIVAEDEPEFVFCGVHQTLRVTRSMQPGIADRISSVLLLTSAGG